MKCPKCGLENSDDFLYCMKCGTPLPKANEISKDHEITSNQSNIPLNIPPSPQQSAQEQYSQQPAAPIFPPIGQNAQYGNVNTGYPSQNNYPQNSGGGTVQRDKYGNPIPPQPVYQYPPQQFSPNSYTSQYSSPQGQSTAYPTYPGIPGQPYHTAGTYETAKTPLNIWSPFAGFGTRQSHISWLMDNKGEQAQDLIEMVTEKFKDRQIPGAVQNFQRLEAKGLAAESRPYFLMRRGVATAALYISQFGKDLYISLASFLKPPISNLKVLILSIMAMFGFYMSTLFPASISNSMGGGAFGLPSSSGLESLGFLLCFIGPLGLLNNFGLFLFFIFSFYKWMTEKDFWAGLRSKPNEFNEDDLMAMQKAAEQTVRIAIDDIGLDPDQLIRADLDMPKRVI